MAPKSSDVPIYERNSDLKETLGSYHYNVWLPEGYSAAPGKRWPALFVMSPGGNANMATMAPVIKERGMICIMLKEAKNGPWEPIVGNFLAAHDDAVKRFRIEEGAKIATGMSGGARGSSLFAQLRPGFRGVVLQAAGAASDPDKKYISRGMRKLFVAMTMGDKDSNASEAERLGKDLTRNRFEVFHFEGGHSWAPTPVFEKALDWVMSEGKVKEKQ